MFVKALFMAISFAVVSGMDYIYARAKRRRMHAELEAIRSVYYSDPRLDSADQ